MLWTFVILEVLRVLFFPRILQQCFAVLSGTWIGLELDEAHGKNDGDVRGYRYFSCPPNHGLLAKHMCCRSVDCDCITCVEANWSKRTMTTIFSSRIPFYFTTSLCLTQISSLGLKGGANVFSFLIWWDFLVPFGLVSRSHFRDRSDFSDFFRRKPRVFRFVCASRSTIFGSQESCIPIKANVRPESWVLLAFLLSNTSKAQFWEHGAWMHSSIQVNMSKPRFAPASVRAHRTLSRPLENAAEACTFWKAFPIFGHSWQICIGSFSEFLWSREKWLMARVLCTNTKKIHPGIAPDSQGRSKPLSGRIGCFERFKKICVKCPFETFNHLYIFIPFAYLSLSFSFSSFFRMRL